MKGCDRILAGAIAWGVLDLIALTVAIVTGLLNADYGVVTTSWLMLVTITLNTHGLFYRIVQVVMAGRPANPFPHPILLLSSEAVGLICLLVGLAFFLFWGVPIISD